jgi:hypothetical protein
MWLRLLPRHRAFKGCLARRVRKETKFAMLPRKFQMFPNWRGCRVGCHFFVAECGLPQFLASDRMRRDRPRAGEVSDVARPLERHQLARSTGEPAP